MPCFLSCRSRSLLANPLEHRRHPGDHARAVLRVEKKQLRVSPHVARIRGDEERQVTDHAHTFGAGVGLQARPLTKQQELTESGQVDLDRQIAPRPVERSWRPADELFWPLLIRGAAVPGLERGEQCIIVEPVSLLPAEALEALVQVRARTGTESLPCRLEQGVLEALDRVELDGRRRKRASGAISRLHQIVLDQPVRADQERVAGERRQGLVRRVAIGGRAQWQRLPPALAGLVKPVDPLDGRRTYIADSIPRGQRRDMQQQARRAILPREGRQPHARSPTAASTSDWASLTSASRCAALLKLSA